MALSARVGLYCTVQQQSSLPALLLNVVIASKQKGIRVGRLRHDQHMVKKYIRKENRIFIKYKFEV